MFLTPLFPFLHCFYEPFVLSLTGGDEVATRPVG